MRLTAFAIAFGFVASSFAAEYRFTSSSVSGNALVNVKIKGLSKEFRMPAWAPGDYEIFNFGQYVDSPIFMKKGVEVESRRGADVNLWTIPAGADEVVYTVKPSRGNFSVNLRVKEDETFVSGPGVFGWFAGHADEKQTLALDIPAGFTVAIPLHKVSEKTYTAANYDDLIDAPFAFGKALRVAEAEVRGKVHRFVGLNSSVKADSKAFLEVGLKAAEQAYQLFGELPYPSYTYFGDFRGGGGSLEHANSTRLGLYSDNPLNSAGTMFHEYFHSFNVKRIRSKPLGPFDYTKPAVTGALWWLEGVTDYYSTVLMVRAGMIPRTAFLAQVNGAFRGLARNPASLKVSADEASRRVWETRGSYGFGGISYYEKGWAIGCLLDIAIRTETGGQRSLDDVVRALYAETKNGPGFSETRIRELCVKIGGERLGPIYDRAATQAIDLPVSDAVAGSGFTWVGQAFAEDKNSAGYANVAANFPMLIGK